MEDLESVELLSVLLERVRKRALAFSRIAMVVVDYGLQIRLSLAGM